ncbi:MAG: tyrosine-type recombinase/integrase [Nitrososphaeria archaeon]
MDIHNYEARLANTYKNLEKADILEENKLAIKEFAELLASMGLNKGRVAKYIYSLAILARRINKPFRDLTKKDVEELMLWLNGSHYSPHTKSDFKKILKRFIKWLKTGSLDKSVPFPPEVSWIQVEVKPNERKKIEVLTDDEIESMIKAAGNARDRALIAVLAEGGFRIGEILPARIKDVTFDERGARIVVTGKTGPRIVRLITSAAALAKWIEEHPRSRDPDAFLWPSLSPNRKHVDRPLSYQKAARILKEIARKAGVQKRIYPHLFRHTAATRDSRYLSDRELILKYGWAGDSSMPGTYAHLSGADLDDKLLAIYAGRPVETIRPKFAPIICPKCGQEKAC